VTILLRLKCEADQLVLVALIIALEQDKFGRFYHSYEVAMSDQHKDQWLDAMQHEMNSLYENTTFELVNLPKGKKALKNKWVYRLKI